MEDNISQDPVKEKGLKQLEIHVLANLGSVYYSKRILVILKEKYKIVSKYAARYSQVKVGISSSSKNNVEFVDPPFYIDKYATTYLLQKRNQSELDGIVFIFGHMVSEQTLKKVGQEELYKIYRHFITDYFLIDGHKFGAQFLVYDKDPDIHHAKYLIFSGPCEGSHMTRLSAACKKEGWYVSVEQQKITKKVCQRTDSKKRVRQHIND